MCRSARQQAPTARASFKSGLTMEPAQQMMEGGAAAPPQGETSTTPHSSFGRGIIARRCHRASSIGELWKVPGMRCSLWPVVSTIIARCTQETT